MALGRQQYNLVINGHKKGYKQLTSPGHRMVNHAILVESVLAAQVNSLCQVCLPSRCDGQAFAAFEGMHLREFEGCDISMNSNDRPGTRGRRGGPGRCRRGRRASNSLGGRRRGRLGGPREMPTRSPSLRGRRRVERRRGGQWWEPRSVEADSDGWLPVDVKLCGGLIPTAACPVPTGRRA